ncbi:MAG: alpha/beta hydrolase [Halioglobus sp.]
MLNTLMATLLRWYYRYTNAKVWKGHTSTSPYSTLQASTAAGQIALRMYAAASGADKPLVVYFHGGGWVIGDLDTHHPFCQKLNEKTGCTVISVDYRLAPKHPFPAAQDDAMAATQWIAQHIAELGPSNGQIVLAGDSAGAHLAITTCLEAPGLVRDKIVGKIAIYPVTDHYTIPRSSYEEKGKGYALTSSLMQWFWDCYLGSKDKLPQRALPLRSDNIHTLPPTLVVTAENDPLRDEGTAYADKLAAANIALLYRHYPNAEHGFACGQGPNADFLSLMDEIDSWITALY